MLLFILNTAKKILSSHMVVIYKFVKPTEHIDVTVVAVAENIAARICTIAILIISHKHVCRFFAILFVDNLSNQE